MSEITTNVLIQAATDYYSEFACPPESIHVSYVIYKDLLHEYYSSTRSCPGPVNQVQTLGLNISVGFVKVLPERDMPPNVDYYFNDDREWTWLDQLFEDIVLRGKHDEDTVYRGSPPQII